MQLSYDRCVYVYIILADQTSTDHSEAPEDQTFTGQPQVLGDKFSADQAPGNQTSTGRPHVSGNQFSAGKNSTSHSQLPGDETLIGQLSNNYTYLCIK